MNNIDPVHLGVVAGVVMGGLVLYVIVWGIVHNVRENRRSRAQKIRDIVDGEEM